MATTIPATITMTIEMVALITITKCHDTCHASDKNGNNENNVQYGKINWSYICPGEGR